MTRFKKLKDWPECLETMSEDELRAELRYWRIRFDQLGHKDAQKGAMNNGRAISEALKRRFGVIAPGPAA